MKIAASNSGNVMSLQEIDRSIGLADLSSAIGFINYSNRLNFAPIIADGCATSTSHSVMYITILHGGSIHAIKVICT